MLLGEKLKMAKVALLLIGLGSSRATAGEPFSFASKVANVGRTCDDRWLVQFLRLRA